MAHSFGVVKKTEQIPANIPSLALESLLIDLLNREGELHHPLLGESMHPTLPSGSLLTVRPLINQPALGDILVFVWTGQLVAHRLIRVASGVNHSRWITTQGDNCVRPDPVRSLDRVIGRVSLATNGERVIWPVGFQPYGRWRWILRAYLLAARRQVGRFIQRSRL